MAADVERPLTVLDLLRRSCGLSQEEAAAFLDVRIDTIRSWSTGRRLAPAGALLALAALESRIETVAREGMVQIDRSIREAGPAEEIEIGIASDDAEAQSLGWPCLGAQTASVGRLVARGTEKGLRFRIVPRGSTPGTAAAADAHDAALNHKRSREP